MTDVKCNTLSLIRNYKKRRIITAISQKNRYLGIFYFQSEK
jgi:hypothetical protein